jgi:hypothetical protein
VSLILVPRLEEPVNTSEQRYQRPGVPRDDRPIRVGSLLFTMVEPHRGHEVAYNRWYERDHFYAGCMVGKWQFAGARYVATRECKAKRYPADSPITPDASTGSYLAVYWVLDEHHDEWNEWGVEQVNWLHEHDRMFAERDHIHTALYEYAGELNADGSTMPVELALDRHYPGIVAMIGEADDIDGVTSWLSERGCPSDVMLVGTPLPLRGDRPADVPDQPEGSRFLHLHFVDEDPVAVWDERFASIGADLEASGLGTIVFASPFLATVPGTDRYTDQLW